MRETENSGANANLLSRAALRAFRLAAIVTGVALMIGVGTVHAANDDDEPEDKTFEQKLIDNLMSGLGGKKIEDGSIDYRERSPLVVPSKTDLPPPRTGNARIAPNWPKDPNEEERRAAREAAKKAAISPEQSRMPLLPSELAARSPKSTRASRDNNTPGSNNTNAPLMMLPNELGYSGGLFSNAFGGAKPEAEKFVSEPEREELTQPPPGYQTPSSNYAYGVGQSKGPTEVCDSASGKCEKRW